MKKIILYALFSLTFTKVSAQNLHAFLFCKTNDQSIKAGIRINYYNFDELTSQVSIALGYRLVPHHVVGHHFNQANVENTIKNSVIGPRDIVLVYISSHGAKRVDDPDKFPHIDVPEVYISSFGIYKELAKKNPKTLIAIVEACSGYEKIEDAQIRFLYKQSAEDVKIPFNSATQQIRTANIIQLFHRGCRFIVSAGQPGMDTWASSKGSLFSNNFLRSFNEITSISPQTPTWERILDKSHYYTYDETRLTSLKHYPVWSVPKYPALVSQSIDQDSIDVFNEVPEIIENITLVRSGEPHRKHWLSKKRYYDFTISVRDTAGVEKVTYFLHHTFARPIVTVNNKDTHFSFKMINVWGDFPIKAVIQYADGTVETNYAEVDVPGEF